MKEKTVEHKLSDFDFSYPEEQVALYPSAKRDESRLLFYNRGNISHHVFKQLPELLHEGDFLIFNNSKVVPARMFCRRKTGAYVEIFLLEPAEGLFQDFLNDKSGNITFKALIGNKKRLKENEVLQVESRMDVFVRIANLQEGTVELIWNDFSKRLADILSDIALIPLPPYIKRKVEKQDEETYQTVYGQVPGSVASTTAGLHFTPQVMESLKTKGVEYDFVTLHVGAGTFLPVKTENVWEHNMHYESFLLNKSLIEKLLDLKSITAVGTTALRALESVYWLGVQLIETKKFSNTLSKEFVFDNLHSNITVDEALTVLLEYFNRQGSQEVVARTGIFILPGYSFKMVKKLITNFHQPKSTLIMLVAAFIGEDWRKVYQEALDNQYRLFSYGDSSLLVPKKRI
ncbi:MAG: tRNA preQ1(34) S-adenosylmethionine ribosyltransferase-isomerase QueA [Bacteroidetes bacterium]|nr:MAG: tRNA preQ1(34) S-adenosylmethionine ribosyltransferase-isomerase QueA [Bacteroidota bacterium]